MTIFCQELASKLGPFLSLIPAIYAGINMPVGCKNDGEEDFFLINTCFLALSPLLIELLCFEMAEYLGHDLAGPVLTLPSV